MCYNAWKTVKETQKLLFKAFIFFCLLVYLGISEVGFTQSTIGSRGSAYKMPANKLHHPRSQAALGTAKFLMLRARPNLGGAHDRLLTGLVGRCCGNQVKVNAAHEGGPHLRCGYVYPPPVIACCPQRWCTTSGCEQL